LGVFGVWGKIYLKLGVTFFFSSNQKELRSGVFPASDDITALSSIYCPRQYGFWPVSIFACKILVNFFSHSWTPRRRSPSLVLPASNSPKLRRRKLIGPPSATIASPHDELKGPGIILQGTGAIASGLGRGSAAESKENIAILTGGTAIAEMSHPSLKPILNPS